MRHINYPLRPATHRPMYMMHKYWARKPHNLVRAYIENYTSEGDLVLDPFCGSGVTVAESLVTGRRAIGVDVNPLAILLTRVTVEKVDPELLTDAFSGIRNRVVPKTSEFYETRCPQCGKRATTTHVVWVRGEAGPRVESVKISCPQCKELAFGLDNTPELLTREERKQEELRDKFEGLVRERGLWYPKVEFRYGSGKKFLQLRHDLIGKPAMDELFTPRNLLVLATIFKEIRSLPDSTRSQRKVKESLLTTFTSSLGQASKMVWVIRKRRGKLLENPQVGSWTHHFFWNPNEYFEVNAWNCFKTRFQKTVVGKVDLASRFSDGRCEEPVEVFDLGALGNPTGGLPYMLLQGDLTSIIREKNPNWSRGTLVDFIFTDPPYGDSIQYHELSSFWNAWLLGGKLGDPSREIVVNKRQGKGLTEYRQMLEETFRTCYSMLKPGKYMVITFHNTEFKYRNALLRSVLDAGFVLDHVIFQHPARRSIKSYLHPRRSVPGDYFLRFLKPVKPQGLSSSRTSRRISLEEQVDALRRAILEILGKRGEPTSFPCMMNAMDSLLVSWGILQDISAEAFEETFYKSQLLTISPGGAVWVEDPNLLPHQGAPLSDKIADYIKGHFKAKGMTSAGRKLSKSELRELLQDLFIEFRGPLTPDEFFVKDYLRERGRL
ncbi:MAG: DNA methyltransferase [Promethearchaeota archaeon]